MKLMLNKSYDKVKYTIGSNTPYAQMLYEGKYAYFNDDDYCALIEDSDGTNHGAVISFGYFL